jgi:hypothetical protein
VARGAARRGGAAAWPVAALRAQLDPSPSPPPLLVRLETGATRRVPVVLAATPRGPGRFVRAADLAAALGGTAAAAGDRVRLTVSGVVVELVDALAFARVGGREVPLAVAPSVGGGDALVPLCRGRPPARGRADARLRGRRPQRRRAAPACSREPTAGRDGAPVDPASAARASRGPRRRRVARSLPARRTPRRRSARPAPW